jgi:hypothetical protein
LTFLGEAQTAGTFSRDHEIDSNIIIVNAKKAPAAKRKENVVGDKAIAICMHVCGS